METDKQYAAPEVTNRKFQIEAEGFQLLANDWRKKGVILVHSAYPVLEFVFVHVRAQPSSVVFAVRIDFTNYDSEPLSVKFIDAFTGLPVKRKAIPLKFNLRTCKVVNGQLLCQDQDLLQGGDEDFPFLCIKGVREYHDNPHHTGESWFLYRGNTGIGTLNHILDTLYNYGLGSVIGPNYQVQFRFNGFEQEFKVQV